jgi:predicted restriction endonuclease
MKSGILILEQVRTGKRDEIAFRLTDEAYTREKALKFFKAKVEREAKRKDQKAYLVQAELEIHYQKRTMAQNNLLRSLERIMSFEQYNTEDYYEDFHEGLIDLYCPDEDKANPLTGRKKKKRTSKLNSVEMAQVIGGAFFELANMGVEITTGNIANYWIEWYNYRGKLGYDPFTDKARTIEEYKHDVPVCECCMTGLRSTDEYGKEIYEGQIAHIVSKGAGGTDDIWNLMHMCTKDHLMLQHQKGWLAVVEKYPHIAFRVANAQIESGQAPIVKADEEWEPIKREIERIEKYRAEKHEETVEMVKDVFDGHKVEELEIF